MKVYLQQEMEKTNKNKQKKETLSADLYSSQSRWGRAVLEALEFGTFLLNDVSLPIFMVFRAAGVFTSSAMHSLYEMKTFYYPTDVYSGASQDIFTIKATHWLPSTRKPLRPTTISTS